MEIGKDFNGARAKEGALYSCQHCRDTGWVLVWKSTAKSRATYGDDRKIEYAEHCPHCNGGLKQRAKVAEEHAGVPAMFKDRTLGDFDWNIYGGEGYRYRVDKERKKIESFVYSYIDWESEGLGLYIYSKTRGTGKTMLASVVCNELMKEYAIPTRFVSASDLLDMDKNGELGQALSCRLLVIDDLGQKKTGEQWLGDVLFKIFDSRMNDGKPTIVTSNIKSFDLEVDTRLRDRMGKLLIPVQLPEVSIRAIQGARRQAEFLKEQGLER